jgi:sulfite reductase alpha subunit-like flavoprotein
MTDASMNPSGGVEDPLEAEHNYFKAVVSCNRRITADDWYQDVRHLEFTFSDNILYAYP